MGPGGLPLCILTLLEVVLNITYKFVKFTDSYGFSLYHSQPNLKTISEPGFTPSEVGLAYSLCSSSFVRFIVASKRLIGSAIILLLLHEYHLQPFIGVRQPDGKKERKKSRKKLQPKY